MHAVTLKNIPDEVHSSLKNIAKINHRSLNNEIIYCLEKYSKISKINPVSVVKKARFIRSKIKHHFSEVEIQDAKNEGRK